MRAILCMLLVMPALITALPTVAADPSVGQCTWNADGSRDCSGVYVGKIDDQWVICHSATWHEDQSGDVTTMRGECVRF